MKVKIRRSPFRRLWNAIHSSFVPAQKTSHQVDGKSSDCDALDPHRIARELLGSSFTHEGSLTLRFYREVWWLWNGQRYSRLLPKEALALLNQKIRILLDKTAPNARVTGTLVANVIQALSGETLVTDCDPPVWLGKDAKPSKGDLLSMTNGLLDLQAVIDGDTRSAVLPQSPNWFSLTSWHYGFQPDAKCPLWEKCLTEILPDPATRNLLQEYLGYLLTHDVSLHQFIILVGEGANGKSLVLDVFTHVLGIDNVTNVGLERFNDRFALARTIGKLANIVSEIGTMRGPVEGILKAIVSGDRITVEFKNQTPFDALPTVRLLFATNVLPEFDDRSDGIWRRVLILPFDVTIPPERQERNLARRICEKELPGIFNWAIAGLRRLRAQGAFTYSSVAHGAVLEHRMACNPERQFLEDCCQLDHDSTITCESLYARYRSWIQGRTSPPVSQTIFGKEIHRVFPKVRRSQLRLGKVGREYRYVGLKLRNAVH